MTSNKDVFFKGVSIQTIITFVMGALEIAVFAIMSRLLSKEDFGYFAALTGIMTICTSISEAGMGAAIIQKKDASSYFISTAFTISWIFGFLGTIIVFAFAKQISILIADENLVIPLKIMSINIFLACIASVRRSSLLKNLEFKKVGTLNVISYTISSMIGIGFALLNYGLYAIVLISVLNLLIFNLLLYSKKDHIPSFRIDKNEVKGISSYGGWLTLSVIVNNITQQMDRLCLSRWLSVTALGSYNRPAGFVSNIAQKINGIFDTVLFPMLSGIQDNNTKVQEIFNRAIALLNSFSIVLFAVFFFNARLIITLFFGEQWLELVPILQIVSVYIIFNIDSRLVDCFFRSLAMVDIGFRLRVISTVFTFIFLYLGSRYGIIGVAISLVSANVLSVLIKVAVLTIKIRCNILKITVSWLKAWIPIIPLCIIGLPFLYANVNNICLMILFAITFSCVIFIEFIIFPDIIGIEYKKNVYPIIKKRIKNES